MKSIEEILKCKQLEITTKGFDGFMGFYFDPVTQKKYAFVFSWGGGWEHASISQATKTPDWDTMCRFKNIFWKDNEVCIQYHPRKEDYVNMHKHCLHIWRPIDVELPTPPKIFVGY